MAVISISKIQVRRGLHENLPTLAGGEFGWSIDQRRLFIGNGTLAEGAPIPGLTEVLTIYSPIGAALSNIAIIESNIAAISAQIALLGSTSYNIFTTAQLADGTTTPANTSVVLESLNAVFDYNITRASAFRVGSVKVTSVANNVYFEDDFTETGSTGIALSFAQYGSNIAVRYTSTTSGWSANLKCYSPRLFK